VQKFVGAKSKQGGGERYLKGGEKESRSSLGRLGGTSFTEVIFPDLTAPFSRGGNTEKNMREAAR